jgi:hypothetical protein
MKAVCASVGAISATMERGDGNAMLEAMWRLAVWLMETRP